MLILPVMQVVLTEMDRFIVMDFHRLHADSKLMMFSFANTCNSDIY